MAVDTLVFTRVRACGHAIARNILPRWLAHFHLHSQESGKRCPGGPLPPFFAPEGAVLAGHRYDLYSSDVLARGKLFYFQSETFRSLETYLPRTMRIYVNSELSWELLSWIINVENFAIKCITVYFLRNIKDKYVINPVLLRWKYVAWLRKWGLLNPLI